MCPVDRVAKAGSNTRTYIESDAAPSGVQHFWDLSLKVEHQFEALRATGRYRDFPLDNAARTARFGSTSI